MRASSITETLAAILRELRVTNALLEHGIGVLKELDHRSDIALHGVMANNERLAKDILVVKKLRAAQIAAANADDDFRCLLDEEGESDE